MNKFYKNEQFEHEHEHEHEHFIMNIEKTHVAKCSCSSCTSLIYLVCEIKKNWIF